MFSCVFKVSRSLLNSQPDQKHSKIPVKLIAATMPAALQWLHRKRFQSAPNIKKLWKVRSSKQMSMINCILYAPTNIIAATTAIFSSSTSSSLKPTNDFLWLVKPKFLMNYHIPDISLWVGRSKVRVPDWQALQVGRLGCLRCRLKKICQMLFFLYFLLGRLFSKSFQIFIFLSITSRSVYFWQRPLVSFQSFMRKIWFDLINICRLKCSTLESLISNSRNLDPKICIFRN